MNFELIILGSSSALPTSKRNTTAHLLNVNERFFLIDCGEGTQIQLRKNKLNALKINHVFISHLHGDHVFGLFGLVASMGMMGRKRSLHIFGPDILQEMLEMHLKYFGPLSFEIEYHRVQDEQVIYEDKRITVQAYKIKHRVPCFAYLFREKERLLNIEKARIQEFALGIEEITNLKRGRDVTRSNGMVIKSKDVTLPAFRSRSYAYVTDTKYIPTLAAKFKEVDLLYHEATFLDKDAALAKKTYHSTAKQAAMFAKDARAKQLLIGHFSTRYKDVREFKSEASEIFADVRLVRDGDRFPLVLSRE